jgi:hypothetical protein
MSNTTAFLIASIVLYAIGHAVAATVCMFLALIVNNK